ncbi:hypothetical protein MFIFM68171_10022 [Madurella fahalii]|uniref:Uncharacterized protein n=1 Tax=Madurella fahalii TaxID=1157608 RepID=A0ABQ0GPY3_9PEZI
MEVAPYEGLEVLNDSSLEVVSSGQPRKLHPVAGSGEALSSRNRICGLPRAIFWLTIAMAVLAITIVGLGVGLGNALSKAQYANTFNSMPTSLANPGLAASSLPPSSTQTSSAPTSTSTATISSTSVSGGVPQPSNICPGANNTIVTRPLATWDDCLNLCNTMNYVQDRRDVGCTWNVLGTGSQTSGTCWCLGGVAKKLVTNIGNVAAVPQ